MTRTERLRVAKTKWETSARHYELDRLYLNDEIRAASQEMTQAEIARVLGWPRQRVNTITRETR